jgi:hypothetical protein
MRSGRKIMETGGSGSTLMHLQDFNWKYFGQQEKPEQLLSALWNIK